MTFGTDQNDLELLPDEPWLVLRGQDALAPHAVAGYAALLRAAAAGLAAAHEPTENWRTEDPVGDLREIAEEAERIAARMIAWQATTGNAALLD